ncbi:MAG TPA: pectate lyase [Cyclobacteriaceae bacterium]|jgi:hypothetical protein
MPAAMPILLTLQSLLLQPVGAAADGKLPAFPGAEGFGMYTSGGRGGKTLIVTNLNDGGPGSLREAIQTPGPRTIVFEITGTIALESPLVLREGNVTIAGQSAPGDGVCISNYPFIIDADNVIIRFLRFRLGDKSGREGDALTAIGHRDIIIDHCSMSWATDECATFYDNTNFTLQWSIISESLNHSVHSKGDHGYGGIWGGMGASFHHNLLAHHNSRLPRFCGARYHGQPEKELVDFRNNVIYNWMSNSSYAGERGQHNIINNYYKPGPATPRDVRSRIIQPYQPYGKFYVAGNIVEGNAEVTQDNRKGVACDHPDSVIANAPFQVTPVNTLNAQEALDLVLDHAGASDHRDRADARVVEEVRTGTARFGCEHKGIIDSQHDVGGWPDLRPGKVATDTDRDGMPDEWEKKMGLRSDYAHDAQMTTSGGYTNLEVYLNHLASKVWK